MNKTNKTILIVDDEEPILNILRDKFKSEGFSVLVAKDGRQGLLEAFNKKPDMILLDILMPNLDGIGMLKKLRKDPWGKDASVLLLTNLSDIEKISEAMQLGVVGYLVKSDWKLDQVVDKVKNFLGMNTPDKKQSNER